MTARTTQFSTCRKYRYTLWREWQFSLVCDFSFENTEAAKKLDKYLMVIGLNPSKADETDDDPTIRRCVGFAKRWGFGALCMTNLFAWRDTKPANMKKAAEPIGPDNDAWLVRCAGGAGLILAAWGKHGAHLGRAVQVVKLLAGSHLALHALRTNGDGSPEHPLYIPSDTTPQRFTMKIQTP